MLQDDADVIDALSHMYATCCHMPTMRRAFAMVLLNRSVQNAVSLFDMFAVNLCDDGIVTPRNRTAALHDIELIMMEHDRSLTHADYGFDLPERGILELRSTSHLLNRHNFSIEDCKERRDEIVSQFSLEQQQAMATILTSTQNASAPNVHCVLAPAGSGKSWFVNGITWHLRAEGKIVINVAASALDATCLLYTSDAAD